jgi:pimeloyl-ACP methyl ester carboxylesterase
MSIPITEASIQTGELTMRYVRAGDGPTTVVLLHGWPQSAHAWRHVIPLLAEQFTVIAPDLRGVGGTDAPGDGYDKATMARDVHALIAQLGLGKVFVIGHDLGAMVAYSYARQFPAETRGAGIVDMPIPGIDGWDVAVASAPAWHFGFHQGLHGGTGVAEALVAGHEAYYFRSFVDRVAGHPEAISDGDVEVYAAAYADPAHLTGGFEMYRTFPSDVEANTAKTGPLEVPILLSFGELSNAPLMETIALGLRNAGATDVRTNVVTDSGHFPAEEQPAQVVQTLIGFIDSIA